MILDQFTEDDLDLFREKFNTKRSQQSLGAWVGLQ